MSRKRMVATPDIMMATWDRALIAQS